MVTRETQSFSKHGKTDGSLPTRDPADDWPTLDVLRLRYIHRAIEHTNNNKTRAAELLGIDRRTLNRILARERARRRSGEATTH
jgi:ActR/RegA family two-component response regulator